MENLNNIKKEPSEQNFFCGRENLTARIYSRIGADRPQSISLVGDPKIGKSSLLTHVFVSETKKTFLKDPENYLYVSIRSKEVEPLNFDSYGRLLSHKLQLDPAEEGQPINYDVFRKTAEILTNQKKKLIFFLDDFHLVTQNNSFPLEFFSFLRSLANNYNIAYITTSHADLQRLCFSKDIEESPFFNIFSNMIVKPFTQEETEKLFKMAENKFPFSGIEKENMIHLAGYFPSALRTASQLLFELKSEDDPHPDCGEYVECLYAMLQSFFEALWTSFKNDEKEILGKLLVGTKIPGQQIYIAENLVRRQYLINLKNKMDFYSPLFKRFVAEKFNYSVAAHSNGSVLMRFIRRLLANLR